MANVRVDQGNFRSSGVAGARERRSLLESSRTLVVDGARCRR
jgi:hypothetical protein